MSRHAPEPRWRTGGNRSTCGGTSAPGLKAAGSVRSAISPKKFSCPLYRPPSRKRPLEAALAGLNTGGLGAKSAVLQHVIRSFDPCIDCTVY
ncbi:hypothetical protein AJ87_10735 [Rhizobium yanglingense]|nr:hypothetical protein AJ87_10735 [Rhizobium yanglingense]